MYSLWQTIQPSASAVCNLTEVNAQYLSMRSSATRLTGTHWKRNAYSHRLGRKLWDIYLFSGTCVDVTDVRCQFCRELHSRGFRLWYLPVCQMLANSGSGLPRLRSKLKVWDACYTPLSWLVLYYYLHQRGYAFISISLFVCLHDYAKTLNQLSQNLVENWQKPLDFNSNADDIMLGLKLGRGCGYSYVWPSAIP